MIDIPRRTWHRWWLEWPKWFRIGCWAVFVTGMLQLMLAIGVAIRVHYGLKPTPEIVALQRPGVTIMYESQYRGQLFPGYSQLREGLRGRSNGDVIGIRFQRPGGDEVNCRASEADLRHISLHFTNLEWLAIGDGEMTPLGLLGLQRCMNLRHLELARLDIDDELMKSLSQLKRLSWVDLTETLVTDASVPLLRGMTNLDYVNLSYTDVSLDEIQKWRTTSTWKGSFLGTEKVAGQDAVLGSIRWIDGSRSAGFSGRYSRIQKFAGGSASEMSIGLTRNRLWWPPTSWNNGDGDYQLSLKLGDYDSEPVTVTVQNGQPLIRTIEFRMPCTKAEALRPIERQ